MSAVLAGDVGQDDSIPPMGELSRCYKPCASCARAISACGTGYIIIVGGQPSRFYADWGILCRPRPDLGSRLRLPCGPTVLLEFPVHGILDLVTPDCRPG